MSSPAAPASLCMDDSLAQLGANLHAANRELTNRLNSEFRLLEDCILQHLVLDYKLSIVMLGLNAAENRF